MKNKEYQSNEGVIRVITTVQKWGNSLAVRIPKNIAENISIEQGTEIEMSVTENQNIILKQKKKTPTLEELLAKITPENRHDEIDFGTEGNELI
ncbi:AbrB/MazE/SpoVT family DNA-binding domain-containing protein [Chengkuizengella sp. SCS-71B]|uniref:AbrB/MazE/SpoVT family DNA-binding domain-containing protein n=1 Tax=Chengkuizengella sp. SCS-71B TaxID=3115290 RepID=UPI0032C2486C